MIMIIICKKLINITTNNDDAGYSTSHSQVTVVFSCVVVVWARITMDLWAHNQCIKGMEWNMLNYAPVGSERPDFDG